MLTVSRPAASLPQLALKDVTSWRDVEWEARERSYHDTALVEINSLVRKYNAMAPYAVRRTVYTREYELDKVYQDSGDDILRGIADRVNSPAVRLAGTATDQDEDVQRAGGGHAAEENGSAPLRIRDMIRQWVAPLRGK